jgi:RND family efflux transporter MFP subunit
MKKIIILAISIMLLISCQQKETSTEGTDETVKPVSVNSQTLILRDLPEYIKISGSLEAETDVVMISELSGKLVKLNKVLGDWVNRNETIGEIDSEVIRIQLKQAEAAVLSAEASYLTARNNLTASENLYERNIISAAEYEAAVTAEKGAKAQYEGASAQLMQIEKMLDNAMIRAPVSGYISELPITLVNYISPGAILCRIVNSNTLMIKTGVGKTVVKQLQRDQKVMLTTKTGEQHFEGTIKGFGVAPMLGSVNYPIEIKIKNDIGLLAGEIVEANILLKMHEDVFVTVQNALVTEFDHTFLYFINHENTIERKEIMVEKVIDDQIIISGVAEGDRIVVIGTENIEDGMIVEIRQEIEE